MNHQPKPILSLIFSFVPVHNWYDIYNVNGKWRTIIARLMNQHSQESIHSFIQQFRLLFGGLIGKTFVFTIREFNINNQSNLMYLKINGLTHELNQLEHHLTTIYDRGESIYRLEIEKPYLTVMCKKDKIVIKCENVSRCFKTVFEIKKSKYIKWYHNVDYLNRAIKIYTAIGCTLNHGLTPFNEMMLNFVPINYFDQQLYYQLRMNDKLVAYYRNNSLNNSLKFKWISCYNFRNEYKRLCSLTCEHYHRLNYNDSILISHYVYGDFNSLESLSILLNCSTSEKKQFIKVKFTDLCRCTFDHGGNSDFLVCQNCPLAINLYIKWKINSILTEQLKILRS